MLESTLKWLILIMALLIPAFLLFHLWIHRLGARRRAQWERELRRSLPQVSEKRRVRHVPPEVSRTLEHVVRSVERAAETGKNVTRVRMKKDFELRAVASDVLALKTPKITLYKSFEQIRIENIKKIEQNYEIRLIST